MACNAPGTIHEAMDVTDTEMRLFFLFLFFPSGRKVTPHHPYPPHPNPHTRHNALLPLVSTVLSLPPPPHPPKHRLHPPLKLLPPRHTPSHPLPQPPKQHPPISPPPPRHPSATTFRILLRHPPPRMDAIVAKQHVPNTRRANSRRKHDFQARATVGDKGAG